jgi:HK97 gp10 family phage protein
VTPEDIDAVIRSVCNQVGGEMAQDIQAEIGDAYPPSSAPSTPPHRRTGDLRQGIVYSVEQEGPITVLSVVSTAFYSGFLEGGTGRMASRPFMGPAQERWTPVIFQRFTEAFSTSQPVLAAG